MLGNILKRSKKSILTKDLQETIETTVMSFAPIVCSSIDVPYIRIEISHEIKNSTLGVLKSCMSNNFGKNRYAYEESTIVLYSKTIKHTCQEKSLKFSRLDLNIAYVYGLFDSLLHEIRHHHQLYYMRIGNIKLNYDNINDSDILILMEQDARRWANDNIEKYINMYFDLLKQPLEKANC